MSAVTFVAKGVSIFVITIIQHPLLAASFCIFLVASFIPSPVPADPPHPDVFVIVSTLISPSA